MNTHVAKTEDNKSSAVATSDGKKQNSGESTLQFSDNRSGVIAQRKLQGMANRSLRSQNVAQLQNLTDSHASTPHPVAKQTRPSPGQNINKTGLPDQLKSGIENLSGHAMDDVKVHFNSGKPAELQAHAYAQGTDIHMGPGQEKYLPHEAWHVVQQKQGRVKPTVQKKGNVPINDDKGLEKEADVMGAKALQMHSLTPLLQQKSVPPSSGYSSIAQLEEIESAATLTTNMAWGLIKSVLVREMADARWSSIIKPLLRAGDTLIANKATAWTGLSTLVPGINYIITASKAALAIWDTIPDNIKTGILYIMGVLTANAPVIGRYQSLQGLIVKGDQGAVRENIQGWVDTAKIAVTYFTQPLTSLYNYLTGSATETPVPDDADKQDDSPSKADAEKLINLNLQVITLMINNLKLGYDLKSPKLDGETEKEGEDVAHPKDPGLIVEFFVQLHLFNQNIPERKGTGMDQLFFPFSGEFKYSAGAPIVINSADKTILGNTLGSVHIHPLQVTKSGVKKAGLNMDKLIIGNGIIILTGTKGSIHNKLIKLKTAAKVNIAGHSLGGAMELQLDDGNFKSLALENVNENGNYKLKRFKLDNSYSGEADIQIDKMDIIKNTLSATNIEATTHVSNKKMKDFKFSMDDFLFDFWGSKVNIEGAHLTYIGANPKENIEGNISGGAKEINAEVKGVNLNLQELTLDQKEDKYEFSKGSVKFKDFEILIEKAALKNGGVEIIKATLSIPKYQIKGAVNSFKWNSSGLDFDSLSLELPGKTISPIAHVQLSNMSLEILKEGGYEVVLTSDINVSPNGGSPLLGAESAQLRLTKNEISGYVKQLHISTSMFEVLINDAEFNKNRVGAKDAAISFKSKEEGKGYSKMMPSFDTGLLDFIHLDANLHAKDVYFNKGKGFSMGAIQPALKAFTITLFGVKATVNPEDRSITIKSSFTFPGSAPPVWPFSMSVPFPIFIGVSGQFGIELGGGVTLKMDTKVQRKKGKNMPYEFDGHPGITGELNLKISAGAEFGARLAVALQANLYAKAGLNFDTTADFTGAIKYLDGKLQQSDPLQMLYELKSAVTAEIGGELRVKAFMFYDKQLTKVKFKDWTLGEWSKSGQFGSAPNGTKTEDKQKGKFGGVVAEPNVDNQIVEGEEARKLLLSARERIIGSGGKRKELITGLTVDISKLASKLLQKREIIKGEFDTSMDDLMKIILRKDAFFRKNVEAENIQLLLTKFDTKNKLKEKREFIREKGGVLDEYESELHKILSLMNNVESGLDVVGLEDGAGNSKEQIDAQKSVADSIDKSIDELTPPEIASDEMERELDEMGAEALTVRVSSAVMTKEKFIEISTTKGILNRENERKRIVVVDNALGAFDGVRKATREQQMEALQNVLVKVKTYISVKFSSRTQAALLLQYQVEQALNKLK